MRCVQFRKMPMVALLFLLAGFTPSLVRAGDFFEPRRGFQFTPGPKSVCDNFLVTEMSLLYRVARVDSKPSYYEFIASRSNSYMLNWQVGYMGNFSEHTAWGGTCNISFGDDRYRFGFGPAYRHWFRHRSFLDVSGGIMLFGKEDDFHINGLPVYAQVGVGVSSIFSVVARVERIGFKNSAIYTEGGYEYPPTEWKSTFYHLGVNVGGEPGAVFCGISAAVYVIAVLTIHHEQVDGIAY